MHLASGNRVLDSGVEGFELQTQTGPAGWRVHIDYLNSGSGLVFSGNVFLNSLSALLTSFLDP